MSFQSIASIALIALLATGQPASAQQPASETESWQTLVSRLEAGASVEVRLKNGSRVRGTVVTSDAETLRVKPHTRLPEPIRTIPFSDVDSVERWKEGMMPGTKTLIGIGVGAGVVFLGVVMALAAGSY
jgi:hypothetical protein